MSELENLQTILDQIKQNISVWTVAQFSPSALTGPHSNTPKAQHRMPPRRWEEYCKAKPKTSPG